MGTISIGHKNPSLQLKQRVQAVRPMSKGHEMGTQYFHRSENPSSDCSRPRRPVPQQEHLEQVLPEEQSHGRRQGPHHAQQGSLHPPEEEGHPQERQRQPLQGARQQAQAEVPAGHLRHHARRHTVAIQPHGVRHGIPAELAGIAPICGWLICLAHGDFDHIGDEEWTPVSGGAQLRHRLPLLGGDAAHHR
ncbi:hypothetical protein CEXT_79481 [Caerostris extrusa]|uniref:Uncharacterized protein n=1 Tax=Caerostris extrusa TaxID=172846 RepID=A0AAV4UQE5_CAEEX|nr:hypothetical protein CEXT_79481 [Caerostris extrusa]